MFRMKVLKYNVFRLHGLLSNIPPTINPINCLSSTTKLNPRPAHNLTKQSSSEQEYLYQLQPDSDCFGPPVAQVPPDPGDLQEEKHFEDQPVNTQKLRIKQYADLIKSHLSKRRIKEAIDVVEVKMLQEDRVKPNSYIYNLLLTECGKVGYTKKAFMLFNQMKKRGLKVTGATYTSLFNACANSPWHTDGLTRAKHLKEIMEEKMFEPNKQNYNCMIKAFGRCGDLETAFSLVDEMQAAKISVTDDTLNFLLQACISDKDAGFRHALLVWRQMIKRKLQPSRYTYNLLLRSIRDCGLGDLDTTQQVLSTILDKNILIAEEKIALIEDKIDLDENVQKTNEIDAIKFDDNIEKGIITTDSKEIDNIGNLRPNLLAPIPHLGSIISLSEIKTPSDRLLLVGGMKGFLQNMEENECRADIKTFTLLLDCLPGNLESEQELLKTMDRYTIKPDLDFYNMLIKKRSMRFEYDSAREVLKIIAKKGYKPDLITYGVLSLGCKTKEQALELINEMKNHSYRLNAEILGTMLYQACYHRNFSYILEIMELCRSEEVKPNKKFMETLAEFKKNAKYISNDKDNPISKNKSFIRSLRMFQMKYKTWLQEIEVDETENEHPWKQYRQTTDTDVRHYKDKVKKFKYKPDIPDKPKRVWKPISRT